MLNRTGRLRSISSSAKRIIVRSGGWWVIIREVNNSPRKVTIHWPLCSVFTIVKRNLTIVKIQRQVGFVELVVTKGKVISLKEWESINEFGD